MSEFKENAKTTGYFAWWVAVFAILIGGGSFGYHKFVAPQVEAARTGVYENSQTYVRGMQRDLRELQRQYSTATTAKDDATLNILRATIREKASSFDLTKLSPDLRSFTEDVLAGRK